MRPPGAKGRNKVDVIGIVRRGRAVTVAPVDRTRPGKFQGVRLSMSGHSWNGMLTIQLVITANDLLSADDPEELIAQTIREMEQDKNW